MVRIFLIILCFLSYGNFNYAIDSFLIFSLINLAFYSFLKEKKIKLFDFLIFISSSYLIEIFLGLPLFISVVVLSIPLLLLSNIINNFFVHFSIISIFIFILSLITFYFLYPEIFIIMKFKDYFLYLLVLIFLGISLRLDGKEQS
jgi:hypothetical protein